MSGLKWTLGRRRSLLVGLALIAIGVVTYVLAWIVLPDSGNLDRAVGVLGVLLTTVGLAFALVDIRRIRSAAEASRAASQQTRLIMRTGTLHERLDLLTRIPDRFDVYLRARNDGLQRLASDWLGAYRSALHLLEESPHIPKDARDSTLAGLERTKGAVLDCQDLLGKHRYLTIGSDAIARLRAAVNDAAEHAERLRYMIQDSEVDSHGSGS